MTPLYSLVSGEKTWRHENKQTYGDKPGIVIPVPVGNALTSCIQKQNHLNLGIGKHLGKFMCRDEMPVALEILCQMLVSVDLSKLSFWRGSSSLHTYINLISIP